MEIALLLVTLAAAAWVAAMPPGDKRRRTHG